MSHGRCEAPVGGADEDELRRATRAEEQGRQRRLQHQRSRSRSTRLRSQHRWQRRGCPLFHRARPSHHLLRPQLVAGERSAAERGAKPGTREVLVGEAGLGAAGSNGVNADGQLGEKGEGEHAAENLTAALERRTIDRDLGRQRRHR